MSKIRPTRWTRQRRVTYRGKGGWHVSRWGFGYTHPVTGNGVSAGWNLPRALRMRKEQEARRAREASERRLWDVSYGYWKLSR